MNTTNPRDDVELALESASEFDLDALESTRLGFRAAGVGALLVLCSIPWIDVHAVDVALVVVRWIGWLLIGLGFAVMAPTPNGPLPLWLKRVYVAVCALAVLRSVAHSEQWFGVHVDLERALVPVSSVAFLLLPWILWRFCQNRGLTGRALTWLWSAVLLLATFALHWEFGARWIVWLYPALGVLFYVLARQTARDVWLDALVRQTKLVLRSSNS